VCEQGLGLGNPHREGINLCYEGSASQTHGRARKFLLFNQLRFFRRLMRLLTRGGFCVGNTACNNLVAFLDDFPIPATLFAVGHNAEFNVFHQLVPRNDYQGGIRTLSTVPHSEHMKARSPGSRPRGEMSATSSILPPHCLQAGSGPRDHSDR